MELRLWHQQKRRKDFLSSNHNVITGSALLEVASTPASPASTQAIANPAVATLVVLLTKSAATRMAELVAAEAIRTASQTALHQSDSESVVATLLAEAALLATAPTLAEAATLAKLSTLAEAAQLAVASNVAEAALLALAPNLTVVAKKKRIALY